MTRTSFLPLQAILIFFLSKNPKSLSVKIIHYSKNKQTKSDTITYKKHPTFSEQCCDVLTPRVMVLGPFRNCWLSNEKNKKSVQQKTHRYDKKQSSLLRSSSVNVLLVIKADKISPAPLSPKSFPDQYGMFRQLC